MNRQKKIGKIIRYIRIEGHLTQQELADRINIGRSTLSDYERGKTDINFDIIVDICKACNYHIKFISDKKDVVTVSNIDRKI